MKWKSIVGIALILASVLGMYLWESRGRERLTSEEVVTAARDLPQGSVVSAEDLRLARLPRAAVLKDALRMPEAEALIGQELAVPLCENQQLLTGYFTPAPEKIPAGQSYFVLPGDWIYQRSSAMRGGDRIDIYLLPQKQRIGSYTVAFVKDAAENDIEESDTRVISHVELLCSAEEYFTLYDAVQEQGAGCLLLVIRR